MVPGVGYNLIPRPLPAEESLGMRLEEPGNEARESLGMRLERAWE